jgi:thiol-disulfide isomerase/thioredoxin
MKQIIFLAIIVVGGFLLANFVSNIDQTTKITKNTSATELVGATKDKMTTKKNYPKYVEIQNPTGFVNTDAIRLGDLVGEKVILLDFMTYTCINCIRTFPYMVSWYDKYKDDGLEIVGIHTPEFAFEKKRDNVVEAMQKYGITFPIVMDNNYATWRAYGNKFWPHKYLIDINGNIVYDHIGEGAYDVTERKIQELLAERAKKLGMKDNVEDNLANPEKAETVSRFFVRSPETYFGTLRQKYAGYKIKGNGQTTTFDAPVSIVANKLHLVGDWSLTGEFAESAADNAKIVFKYQAKKVFLVASSEQPIRARILVDGEPVGDSAGDAVVDGFVTFRNEELYRIIENSDPGEHILEIIMEEPGVRAFAFTFG